MILIGQYDSPFVRRVGIALRHYGLPFEHRPWSVFGDAERLRAINPLVRVPTLVLDDGGMLTDSHIILDHLDGLVPESRAMFPRLEPERHRVLGVTALVTGLAEKAVSLFYERRLHETVSDVWADRCRSQIEGVASALERDRAGRGGPWWFGNAMSHADVALACTVRFVEDVHPGLLEASRFPVLRAEAARMEALPLFAEISQPFIAPA